MARELSNVISKVRAVWAKLSSKEYRDAFVSAKLDSDLAAQIYALREQRGLTQGQLGDLATMAQPRIAKLEGSCESVNLSTLKRLASAFDVGLSVRFVPFSELVAQSVKENVDRILPQFPKDQPPAEFTPIKTGIVTGSIGQDLPYQRRYSGERNWSMPHVSVASSIREDQYVQTN